MFMNKRDANKDNLILFPGLEKRLLEKGLDYLKQKKYRDAIQFLEQALVHDPENSDIHVGLVLANFEAGYTKQAKQIAAEMLREGLGDYVQVIDLYLMILVQLNEYKEIVDTIEALLEEKEISADKYEHFSRMLDFARRMEDGEGDMKSAESLEVESEGALLGLFNYTDPEDQVMLAAQLAKENIRPYIKEIREYVASEEGHPFQKTMLLNILKEQEYAEEIHVQKFGWERALVPANLPELKDYISHNGVIPLLSSQVESADPVLFENIMSLIERHFFLIYPFDLPKGPLEAWAAAYHYLAKEYYGSEESLETFAGLYRSSYEETEQVLIFIRMLEEISYPII